MKLITSHIFRCISDNKLIVKSKFSEKSLTNKFKLCNLCINNFKSILHTVKRKVKLTLLIQRVFTRWEKALKESLKMALECWCQYEVSTGSPVIAIQY